MDGDDKAKINSVGDGDVELNEDEAVKEQLTSTDPSKIKYVNNDFVDKNGDAKVDIENIQLNAGMRKDELMKYANEPFWIRTRMILFILFWVAWLAMLIGAIVIIVVAPRCAPPPQLDWWQKSVFYHVYVASFKDSNGDGIGDLKGLTSKLDYIKSLEIDSLLMSPIYKSPMKDNGYDISNYTDIESKFGTMEDFDNLLSELKKRDMKIVIDFVPNHSSDQHPWFEKSVKKIEPYTDYYIWANGTNGKPPNNWVSVFGGSAWEYNRERDQYYLHQFYPQQPDLNLRNPLVKEELQEILLFWLDKDIDGFRIDATAHFFEDKQLLNEPPKENSTAKEDEYEYLDHIYTKNLPDIYILLDEWKELLNNYSHSSGSHKIMMTEAYDNLNNTMKYYGTSEKPLADIPFNFKLLELKENFSARELLDNILYWTEAMPLWAWPNWVLGNHDVERLASRIGPQMIDGIFMVTLLNKGTPVIYYGDEIGMENAVILPPIITDKRDAYRTPMQWSNDTLAGFTNGNTSWLPVQPNVQYINVENEKKDPRSHLSVFHKLVKLRSHPAIRFGIIDYPIVTKDIFSMLRIRKGSPGYLVAFNVGANETTIDFTGSHANLPNSANIEIRSSNLLTGSLAESGKTKFYLNEIELGPGEAVVLSFVPKYQD